MLSGDRFIMNAGGIRVRIYRITNPVYDSYGNLDWDNSTKTYVDTKMIVGNRRAETPSLDLKVEGWDYQEPYLICFFPSDVDIGGNGGPDSDVVELLETARGLYANERYRVTRTDIDRIMGYLKKRVFLSALRGWNSG